MSTLGGKKGEGKFGNEVHEKRLPPILSKTLVLTASHSLRDTMLLFIVSTFSVEHKHYYFLVTNVCSITLSTLHAVEACMDRYLPTTHGLGHSLRIVLQLTTLLSSSLVKDTHNTEVSDLAADHDGVHKD